MEAKLSHFYGINYVFAPCTDRSGKCKKILPVFWIKVLGVALHSLDYLHYDPIFEKLKTDLGNVQLSLITFLFHISVNFSSLSNHSFVDPIHIYYFRAVNKVCNFY